MTYALSLPMPLLAAAGLVAGLLIGIAYFAALLRTVRLFTEGRPLAAGLLQGGRFALVAVVLFEMAHLGPLPLLTGGLGIVIGRSLVLHRNRVVQP